MRTHTIDVLGGKERRLTKLRITIISKNDQINLFIALHCFIFLESLAGEGYFYFNLFTVALSRAMI